METMARPITNNDDVIDSRDLIDRAYDLIDEFLPAFNEQQADDGDEDLQIEREDALHDDLFNAWLEAAANMGDERDELVELLKVWRECENFSDWTYGEQLIRDNYFTEYARQMLEDCGTIPSELPWYVAVDWDKTADNIKVDYTYVDFNGVDYWIRNC
jgi:hypothetical protein